ncbi:MAG: hypothetical protein ACRCZD_09480 [Phycicoccus sp.]
MSSLSSTWTCDQCRRRVRGAKHRTMIGRTVCTSCQHDADALAITGMSGGGLGDLVAFRGARRWIRSSLGRPNG